jgi:septal ring factor EnvC (AmiA/AmiB activator)
LSAIIKTDFEQPLRDLPSKIVSWRRIGDQDASLEKTLKDYEKTSSKLEKASQKSKSGKTDALSNELSQLTSSLSSLSPMVYTTYQRLDEERLRTLKEILVRWGTIRADMSQRDGERAERSVAVLVSLETQDEVLAVGRKLGGSSGDSRSQQSNNARKSLTLLVSSADKVCSKICPSSIQHAISLCDRLFASTNASPERIIEHADKWYSVVLCRWPQVDAW